MSALPEALAGLDPGALREAARLCPAPWKDPLQRLADALERGDQAAVHAVLDGLPAQDPARLRELAPLLGAVDQNLVALASRLGRPLERPWQSAPPEIEALFTRMQAATQGLEGPLAELLTEARGLTAQLQEVVARPEAAKDLADRARQLERSLEEQARPEVFLGHLLPIVDEAVASARLGQSPALGQALVLQAALQEALGAPSISAWREAFEAAAAAGDLPTTRRAAQRLQVEALETRDLATLAEIARRVGDCALAAGDPWAALLARSEEALALAHLGDPTALPLARSNVTFAESSGDPRTLARARLTLGEIEELRGDPAMARRVWSRLARDARHLPACAPEVGRAAYHLARLTGKAGQITMQRHYLELAVELADAIGDWRLYGPAAIGLAEVWVGLGERDKALDTLSRARARAASLSPESEPALARAFEVLQGGGA